MVLASSSIVWVPMLLHLYFSVSVALKWLQMVFFGNHSQWKDPQHRNFCPHWFWKDYVNRAHSFLHRQDSTNAWGVSAFGGHQWVEALCGGAVLIHCLSLERHTLCMAKWKVHFVNHEKLRRRRSWLDDVLYSGSLFEIQVVHSLWY